MNRLFLTLALLLMDISAMGHPQAPQDSLQAGFSPAAAAVLRAFGGTKSPEIPQMTEKRALIKRPLSVAPGRMILPREIIVNKDARRLALVNALGDTLARYPICSSRNRGQKKKSDDCRTPEGTFPLYGLYDSTDWTYKDTDSKAYGPWFLSLKTPRYWGVGIHGTNAPGSVPGRSSHGCIRLHNEDITTIKSMALKDMLVTVLPDPGVIDDDDR